MHRFKAMNQCSYLKGDVPTPVFVITSGFTVGLILFDNLIVYNTNTYKDTFITSSIIWITPDGKVHGVNMGPIWPQVSPLNFVIWDGIPSRLIWYIP